MRRLITTVCALGTALTSSVGCGGPGPVDFFDASAGRSAATAGSSSGGSSNNGGALTVLTAGSSALAGSAAVAGSVGGSGSSGNGFADAPCAPVVESHDKTSGDFQSTGPLCLRVTDEVIGWGCSNFDGRTVKVNGVPVTCAQVPLPGKLNGAYYFDISAGDFSYASFYWWSS